MIYKIIRPLSFYDPSLENDEWVISWVSRTGSHCMKMFYNIRLKHTVSSAIQNSDIGVFASINQISDEYQFTIEDVSFDDLMVFQSIAECRRIYRCFKDGTYEAFAPLNKTNTAEVSDKRYNYTFSLRKTDVKRFKH